MDVHTTTRDVLIVSLVVVVATGIIGISIGRGCHNKRIVKEPSYPVEDTNPVPENPRQAEIEAFISDWKRAWESGNISWFMGFYSPWFSSRGLDYSSLRDYQSRVFNESSDISLSISNFRFESLSDNHAVISFKQYLEIGDKQDKGWVRMRLVKENGYWLISEETWEPLN